jgi:hypothetical protein
MDHLNPEANIGRRQCRLRMVLGLVLMLVGLFSDPIGMLLYELGGLLFLTGAVGFCPSTDLRNANQA